MTARQAITLALIVVLQVSIITLMHVRSDLPATTFVGTYWPAIATSLLLIAIIATYHRD